jgi:hypothetical protein
MNADETMPEIRGCGGRYPKPKLLSAAILPFIGGNRRFHRFAVA